MPITRIATANGTASIGPTDPNPFSLADSPRDNIITPGESEDIVQDDMNLTSYGGSIVDHEFDLIAAENTLGVFTPYLRYRSKDTDIAEVDENGIVTRVSDGTVKIIAETAKYHKSVEVTVERESGATVIVFRNYIDGSYGKECSDAIDSAIATKNPSTDRSLFTGASVPGTSYVRNTSCWINGFSNFTCIPAWCNWINDGRPGGCLVSPRDILFARHFTPPNGTVFDFVKSDNTRVRRTLVQVNQLSGEGYSRDISVGTFDSDVSSGIEFAKVMPANTASYLPSQTIEPITLAYTVPCVRVNRFKTASVADLYSIVESFSSYKVPSNATRASFYQETFGDDSGSPFFLAPDNELVLQNLNTFPDSGVSIYSLITDINAVMTSNGSPYQLTVKDLSAFTEF